MATNVPWLWSLFFFGIGLILGSVLYRGDFCMAGILRDIFLFRDYTLLRHLLLAVILSTLFFLLARAAGILPPGPPPNFRSGSLFGVLGGLMFGIGMVLAGGCVVSTLYKMAAGNLAHALAFAGIIVGSLLYAELYPLLLRIEDQVRLGSEITLTQLWPQTGRIATWLAVGAAAVGFVRWYRQGRWHVTAGARGYLQPWRVALTLALLNLAVYVFSGWPLGISTAYSKLGAFLAQWIAPGHAAGLDYFNQTTLAVIVGDSVLNGGGGPQVDLFVYTQVMLMSGIVAGAFLNALLLGEFRIYGLPPLRQGLTAFTGGLLVALGARIADGCNITHLLGGLPLLAIQSVLFVVGMLAGAWIGTRLIPKIIFR